MFESSEAHKSLMHLMEPMQPMELMQLLLLPNCHLYDCPSLVLQLTCKLLKLIAFESTKHNKIGYEDITKVIMLIVIGIAPLGNADAKSLPTQIKESDTRHAYPNWAPKREIETEVE